MMFSRCMMLAGLLAAACVCAGQSKPKEHTGSPVGYEDTQMLPGQPWRVHDIKRPHPRLVTPAATPGGAPSDAIVLFDGKDLSKWQSHTRDKDHRQVVAPSWKVENGYAEVAIGGGDIFTKEKFGDIQLHIEWATPAEISGSSQDRGNSGVLLMGEYEIQVLDSYNNVTYADGQAGALYGQWPPLVNASRKPGEWQTYDIAFEAPLFENGKLVKPGYATVFHNGVLLHNRKEIMGRMVHRILPAYHPHGPEEPLRLQNHDTKVRYRNIWVRRLTPYDQP